jgi:glycerol-1-phosphate dehydrogenase [NAD(P)+]
MTFQPPHYMQLPRDILIGQGVLNKLTDVCLGLGFRSSIFVLTGQKVYGIITSEIIRILEKSDYEVELSFIEEANMESVNEAKGRIKKLNPDVVLGIGGGKTIDVAKLSSTFTRKPFISIPTAASHDGISSSRASIKGLNEPTSIQAQAPIAILADTEVISKAPYKLTASGCGDIISKFTAVRDWEVTHNLKNEYYGEYAANLALMSSKLVMKNAKLISGKSEEGFRIVLEALISCGVAISIAGSSRPCSGSEHLFSHALDRIAEKPALHGEQCGVGAIMMAYLQKRDWKMLRDKLKLLNAPTSAEELGIEAKYVVEALTLAHKIRPERHTVLGSKGLTQEAAETLARLTEVIE